MYKTLFSASVAVLSVLVLPGGTAAFAYDLPGGPNASLVSQSGSDNSAWISVVGSMNLTTVVQIGEGHSYNYSYVGDNQGLAVVQVTIPDVSPVERSFSLDVGSSFGGLSIVIEATKAPDD